MRVAVIGAGISGLTAAYLIQREHEVEVFEAAEHAGGHTRTVDVELDGRTYPVDTGFVVYNETTYPNFVKLLDRLGIDSQPTAMSFSVSCESSGLEYCGTSMNTLFAQRRNLLNVSFYRMLLEIARFNRVAGRSARSGDTQGPLRDYLRKTAGSVDLHRRYIVPLISSIWSMDPGSVDDFPAAFFLRFADRHRLLQVRHQLRWRVVRGGAREYVRALVSGLRNGVRTRSPVRTIRRLGDGVEIELPGGDTLSFDQIVLALHSDQAMHLLEDPSDDEREILGAINYQENTAVLHTDVSLMPRSRRAWANWNYRIPGKRRERPITTYDMSGLQGLDSPEPILVTLNDDDSIEPGRIIERNSFAHPVYTTAAVEAQKQKQRISGVRRTHYCGAYWGYGFHEDGVASALQVGCEFGQVL